MLEAAHSLGGSAAEAGVNIIYLLETSALPVVKVGLLCLIGALASYVGILSPASRKAVSTLVFNIFTPSLMSMKLMGVVDFDNIHLLWSLPVNICLSILIGSALGYTSARLLGAPKEMVGMLSAVTALGNVGNLPLVLVDQLGRGDSPFGYNVADLGIAYVCFGIWVASIFQFSVSYYLLAPPETLPVVAVPPSAAAESITQHPHHPSDHTQDQLPLRPAERNNTNTTEPIPISNVVSTNDLNGDYRPLSTSLTDDPFALQLGSPDEFERGVGLHRPRSREESAKSLDSLRQPLLDDSPKMVLDANEALDAYHGAVADGSVVSATQTKQGRSCLSVLYAGWLSFKNFQWGMIFTFPIKCMFAAIIAGLIPPIKGLFFGAHPPLEVVKDTLNTMGNAMIPCMMAVLGANLCRGPPKCKLPYINIAAVVLCRLIIAPCIGTPIVIAAIKYGIVRPPDQLFVFVLLLQHCMPTAINMHTVATLHQNGVEEVTTALFWQYLLSLITLPMWMLFFLYLLHTVV